MTDCLRLLTTFLKPRLPLINCIITMTGLHGLCTVNTAAIYPLYNMQRVTAIIRFYAFKHNLQPPGSIKLISEVLIPFFSSIKRKTDGSCFYFR